MEKPTSDVDFRKVAENLWEILHEIDMVSQTCSPNDFLSFQRLFGYVNNKVQKRFKYFNIADDELFTIEEHQKFSEENQKKLMESLMQRR